MGDSLHHEGSESWALSVLTTAPPHCLHCAHQRPCLSVALFTRSGRGALSCPTSQAGEQRLAPDLLEQRAPCRASPDDSHALSGQRALSSHV